MVSYISDATSRSSTSYQCYTVTPEITPFSPQLPAITDSSWVQFNLNFSAASSVTIYTVKLTITQDPEDY